MNSFSTHSHSISSPSSPLRTSNTNQTNTTTTTSTNRGEYYYYLLGWCTISLVIGFLLLPPTTSPRRSYPINSTSTSKKTSNDPYSQLATWFSLSTPPTSLSTASSPLPSSSSSSPVWSSKFTQPPSSNFSLTLDESIQSNLDQPRRWSPTANEILGPVRYPTPLISPNTTTDGLTFHPNGNLLLQFPSSHSLQTHPILTLINRGRIEWESKVARQSKSLREAVLEYKRRYSKNPPAGFDQWYAFALQHQVGLVDEYDQISRDLFPFWALSPTELRSRADTLEAHHPRVFVLRFDNGTVKRTSPSGERPRADKLVEMFQLFSHHLASAGLPPTSLVMEEDDRAQVLLGWDQWKRLFELARLGQYLPTDYKVQREKDAPGWVSHCPPSSSLRRTFQPNDHHQDIIHDLDTLVQQSNHSWIFDHARSMDLCMSPERIKLHGATAGSATGPVPIVPLFAFSKTTLHADILITPLEQYSTSYSGKEIPWAQRENSKLYWRGSTTGAEFSDQNPYWNSSHRIRLYHETHESNSNARVLVGGDDHSNASLSWTENSEPIKEVVKELDISRSELNDRLMNITFVNRPIQCAENVCKQMSKMINFVPVVSSEEVSHYKYAIDVDGNGWSGRFHRLLWTKHLVIKSTILPEWYTDRLQPWYHYVPAKVDYSDLYNIMTFFAGGINGSQSHDHLAEGIAEQGRQWARTHWRFEDMAAYMFRLILEWTRLYHRGENGESGDFDESLIKD